MSYWVWLHLSTVKFLGGLDERTRNRIKAALRQLGHDSFRSRLGTDIKRIKGTKGWYDFFRLRVGDYQVIYAVVVGGRVVWVTEIFKG